MPRPDTNGESPVHVEQIPRRPPHLVLAALLVAATFVAYWPAVSAGYIWDDADFLYENPLIRAPDGLQRIWFTAEAWDYWPLWYTMFWLEWRMWGNNPMPYHVGNILLHAVAAALLWRVLRRLNVSESGAYLAGLIFAVHPVTVESVAWIAERKNVLSMVLYLLAILAYLRFESCGHRRWYAYALLAAAAALLAKASVAMLPLVLLLCVWWRRGGLTRRDILRTLPFFALSLALGLVTVWFQHHHGTAHDVARPEGLASRIAASGWVVWFYLYKIFLPIDLAMIYPRWDVDGGRVISFVPLGALIACFAVLWYYRRSWGRAPLAALGYFVLTLLPVLGFIGMPFAIYTLVADHLQYLSMVGVIALVSGLPASWISRAGTPRSGMARGAGLAAACGVVLTLGTLTWRQARVYKDEESLWTHTIQINDRAWNAYVNLGVAYYEKGDYDRAIREYARAIELKPDYAAPYFNRGIVYHAQGDFDREILEYTKAIALKPDYAGAYCNRGIAYAGLGNHEQAIRDLTRTIELRPNNAAAYANRAIAYYSLGQYDKAWADVRMCRQLGGTPNPGFVRALVEATAQTE